jgi:hypothetical protein
MQDFFPPLNIPNQDVGEKKTPTAEYFVSYWATIKLFVASQCCRLRTLLSYLSARDLERKQL